MQKRRKLFPRKEMPLSRRYFDVVDQLILLEKHDIDAGQVRQEPGALSQPFKGKNIDESASILITQLDITHTLLTRLTEVNKLRGHVAIWARQEKQSQTKGRKRSSASKQVTDRQLAQIEQTDKNEFFFLITFLIDQQLDTLTELDKFEKLPRYNMKYLRMRAANGAFLARNLTQEQSHNVLPTNYQSLARLYAWAMLDITSEVHALYGINKLIADNIEKSERLLTAKELCRLFNIAIKPHESRALQKAREQTRYLKQMGLVFRHSATQWIASAELMEENYTKTAKQDTQSKLRPK